MKYRYIFHSQKKGCLMKSKMLSSVLCFAFLATLSVSADEQQETPAANEQQETKIYLSAVEVQEIFNNPDRSYVYLGKEVSVIPQVIAEISKLEDNQESLVWLLANHIEKGFVIGNYEAVVQSLEQAQLVLRDHADALDENTALALSQSLDEIIEHVTANNLSLNAEMLAFLKDSVTSAEEEVLAEEVATEV